MWLRKKERGRVLLWGMQSKRMSKFYFSKFITEWEKLVEERV